MLIVLLALLVLILFGAGFAVHLLWIAAVVLAIVWVASFALSRGEGASRRSAPSLSAGEMVIPIISELDSKQLAPARTETLARRDIRTP